MALVWRAISSPENQLLIARKPAGNCKEKPKSGGGRPKKHKITAKSGGTPCFFVVLLLSCFLFQTPPPWKSPSLFPALPRLLKPPLPIRPPTKSQGPSRRRCASRPWRSYNDYTAPKIYMVTLVVEGRRPLFGTLSGDPHIPYATQGGARLSLTALGKTVKRLWYSIPQYHPQVRVEALQLMPDHLHGILRITEGGQLHLGDIVRGFKTGCNKAYRQLHPAPDDAGGPSTAPPLFERGYNDRILYGYGKLQTWLRYLAENPRRLLIKRSHRDFFHIHRNVCFNGLTLSTVGNTLLLHHPVRLQVRCHRNETPEAIERLIRHFITAAKEGAVLVSPAISPAEKAVMHRAMDERLPVIIVKDNGFSDYYKPSGRAFYANEAGLLLIVSQAEHHNERTAFSRNKCLELNEMARLLCQDSPPPFPKAPF